MSDLRTTEEMLLYAKANGRGSRILMDEASCGAYTRKKLKERGYVCLKFNDTATSGIPDSTYNYNGRTLYVEDKFLKLSKFAANEIIKFKTLTVSARKFIKSDRMTQMVLMVQLEKNASAEYWLYLEYDGKLYVARLSPKAVWESYRVDQPMTFKVEKAEECRNSFQL